MLLPRHVVNIVVAVLVIILLMFLGSKLINFWIVNNELENSATNLDLIVEKIRLVNAGDFEEQTVIVTFPRDWYLRSVKRNKDPEICDFISCLCICSDLACTDTKKCEGFDYEVEVNHRVPGESIYDRITGSYIIGVGETLKIDESVINMRVYLYGEEIVRVQALEK